MSTIIDLFSGAGGLSYGFEMAGFKVAAAIDNDPLVGETYRRQNPGTPLLTQDVAAIRGDELLELAGGSIDVVIGGPSCQGFSTHGKRDPNDPRNSLFQHFVRLVGETRPLWVVMENVKGLLTYDKGRYQQEIRSSFSRIGYRCDSRVLLAADYGVPQMRERLFFIATRTQSPISFPAPTHCPADRAVLSGLKPYVTVREAIGDLPTIGEDGEEVSYAAPPTTPLEKYARRNAPKRLTLHRAKRVSDLAMSIIRQIPQGAGLRAIAPNRLPARFKRMRKISTGQLRKDCTTLYYRLHWDRPSYTITCYFTNVSSGPFVHPSENRAITPREAARLQTFPDAYRFFDRTIARQIGNAVPPLLAFAVATEIAQALPRMSQSRENVALTA